MPILIGAQELGKSFSARPLFQGLSFSIESGDRIGLIGPNGAGKSTLLSILAGRQEPDSGKLSIQRGLKIGYLEQVPKFPPGATVRSAILEAVQGAENAAWELQALSQELMAKLELSTLAETPLETLSGGWKKRVALARELLRQPDLLLLDEPTNHLDVQSIQWLEEFLAHAAFATLTITHDRVFLQRVSTRILELNRRYPGGVLDVKGDYVTYLETRESLLAAQASQESRVRNTLRRETEWLRRGAKARTTKQQARIQRAEALGEKAKELAERNTISSARFDLQGFERNPKKLLHAERITLSYDGRVVVPPTDLLITPKSRIGLLGANGCGKSTLLRLLLKLEEPDSGSVFHSENLRIAYFEQNRESLDPDLSVLRTICPVGEYIHFAGNSVHVRTYLEKFLFTGGQVEMAVGRLSGGEQSRLLLARLMLQECNLLVLDEPTNDLDMVTLDLLQEVLQEFQGAVIVVTHDRYFLDQVAHQILGFFQSGRSGQAAQTGRGEILAFASLVQWESYQEELRHQERKAERRGKPSVQPAPLAGEASPTVPLKRKKLGFNEQRELAGMEPAIEKAEARLAELSAESTLPEVVSNSKRLLEITQEMSTLQEEIDRLYARWAELTE